MLAISFINCLTKAAYPTPNLHFGIQKNRAVSPGLSVYITKPLYMYLQNYLKYSYKKLLLNTPVSCLYAKVVSLIA